MPVAYFRAVWASEFGGSELVLYGFQGAVGSYFRMRLTELARRFSFIKEIRGEGLMVGAELTFPCKQLVLEGIERGLLFNCTHDTVLRFLPPYILPEKHVDRAMRILTKILQKAKPPET